MMRLPWRRKPVPFEPFGRPRLGLSERQVAGLQRPAGDVLVFTKTHGASRPDRVKSPRAGVTAGGVSHEERTLSER